MNSKIIPEGSQIKGFDEEVCLLMQVTMAPRAIKIQGQGITSRTTNERLPYRRSGFVTYFGHQLDTTQESQTCSR